MGIKVDHTPLEAVLALSKSAGETRQANAKIEREERVSAQIRGIQASKEMVEFNAELDLQKLKQVQVIQMQAEARAQQWDIEKATLASQADFIRQERQRNEALDQYEATEKYLDEHADDFDESQLNQARFDNLSRLQGRGTKGTTLREPQKEVQAKQVSPTQKIAAIKALQGDEFQEPGLAQRAISGLTGGFFGAGELDPEIQAQKEILEAVVRGEYAAQPSSLNVPQGTISSGLPEPTTQEEYDRIPKGEQYKDSKGNVRTKN